ncbi:MAG: Na-translocating system protein MpsC family protein [Solirubrobacterales bacterium]
MTDSIHLAPLGLEEQISASILALYEDHYGHARATANTYINGKTVLCMIEDSVSKEEGREFDRGEERDVIDRRVTFQLEEQDAFTAEVERITECEVVAFLSANQDNLDFAAELFVLDRPPGT